MKLTIIYMLFVIIAGTWVQASYAQIDFIDENQDTSQPIDITSETLTVNTEKNTAAFEGNVKAIQGQLTLISDRMDVHYHSAEDKKKMGNSLSKIITQGNVELTLPNKKAESEEGIYNVDKHFIVLTGNVLLTQDSHTLKGERFTYNVATGESKMISGKLTGDNTAPKGNNINASTGRVKAVFIPEKKDSNSNNDTVTVEDETSPTTVVPVPVKKPPYPQTP